MAVNYKAELVGVFGYPVAENPTCVIQEAAFQELGLNWRYLTIEVKPEGLAEAMKGLKAMGFQGINLTIPHKVAVMQFLDEISPDAVMIGAVNTVRRDGTRLIGENTDGKGFLRSLHQDGNIDIKGKHVAVLGAGGAARAITFELALAGAAELRIINRSGERGEALVNDLTVRTGIHASFVPWASTYEGGEDIDILVNATSIGLFPDVDAVPDISLAKLRSDVLVCDVVPNPPETRFIQTARARNLKVLTGLPMLVYQGAIGFEMWTGHKAPESVMKKALEQVFRG